MPAKIDRELVSRLDQSFPGANWYTFASCVFIADRGTSFHSDWSYTKNLQRVGGVYAILLPIEWFQPFATLPLHAPHSHNKIPIPFEFTLPDFTGDGYGVVYVGRTTNLCQRWRGHFSPGERKDGGQVKFGLMDCGIYSEATAALRALRQHARIIYTALPGPDNCVNRDLLEMSLCARFAPPFNIKSER